MCAFLVAARFAAPIVSLPPYQFATDTIFHRAGLPVGDFKKSWRTATKAAQCQGRLFHDLRRTVARQLLAAGVPQAVAMKITGHETDEIFRRYALADAAALILAAQKKVARFRKAI